jgi:CheY-like chemotaxis protein
MKVLVIDDDPIATKIVKARLEAVGHTVVTRNRPLGTAFVLAQEKPDVLLLDLNMPMLDGEVLAKLVSSHNTASRLRIVFHSDMPIPELEKRTRSAKVAGFVAKTADDREFITRFNEVVKVKAAS